MANTLWDLSTSLAVGYTRRSIIVDSLPSVSGLQTEAAIGPKTRWGDHSAQFQAFYQNSFLSEGILVKNEGQMVHTFGGNLGYRCALAPWLSFNAHFNFGGVKYTGSKSQDAGKGFSLQLETPLGLHAEAGGGIYFLGDGVGLTGSYFGDFSALRINAAAGPVIGSARYSYDVKGVNILLQLDLYHLLKNP